MTNGTDLQRGRWRLEVDGDGNESQVEDHSGRHGQPPISPRPQPEPAR